MTDPSDGAQRQNAEAQSPDRTRQLPQHVLSIILQSVPKFEQPDIRSSLALVCKAWRECASLLPDVVLNLASSLRSELLTAAEKTQLNTFLRSLRTLAIHGLAERQLKLAIQIAACAGMLSSLELHFREPLHFKWDQSAGLQICPDFAALLLLQTTHLLKLDVCAQNCVVLLTLPQQGAGHPEFASIVIDDIDLLRGLVKLADGMHDWQQTALDKAVLSHMPSLRVIYASQTDLYSTGFKGLLLGPLQQETQQSFREAAEVHCLEDRQATPEQQQFLEICEPFLAITCWLCRSAQCPSTIYRVAPNLQVLHVKDVFSPTNSFLIHMNLIPSLRKVSVSYKAMLHVFGCPIGIEDLVLEAHSFVLSGTILAWLTQLKKQPDKWHVEFYERGSPSVIRVKKAALT